MKKPKIIYPFLFAMYPLLAFFSHNIVQGMNLYAQVAMSLGIVIFASLIIYFLFKVIYASPYKGGLFLAVFTLLFFSYGHVHEPLEEYFYFKQTTIGADKVLFSLWSLLLIASFFVIYRLKSELIKLTQVLNLMGIVLIAMPLLGIGSYELQKLSQGSIDKNEKQAVMNVVQKDGVKRDIYFVILDAYANAHSLKDFYGFDNSDFLDELKSQGFYVVDKSTANYSKTRQSLSAVLNMEYINHLGESNELGAQDQRIFFKMIKDNKVARFLKAQGYKFVSVYPDRNPHADVNVGVHYGGNEFQMVLVQTTMLAPFASKFIKHNHGQQVLSAFKKIGEVTSIEGPKFVFAHIMSPHPPFIFNKDGELVDQEKLKMFGNVWQNKSGYVEQIKFVNNKVLALIDEIKSQSAIDPVIVFQGDHGGMSSWQSFDADHESNYTRDNLRDIFGNLSAIYIPEGSDQLYPTMSQVNTFRVVLNKYFDAGFEILDDRSYYTTSDDLYDFVDVTEQIDFNTVYEKAANYAR